MVIISAVISRNLPTKCHIIQWLNSASPQTNSISLCTEFLFVRVQSYLLKCRNFSYLVNCCRRLIQCNGIYLLQIVPVHSLPARWPLCLLLSGGSAFRNKVCTRGCMGFHFVHSCNVYPEPSTGRYKVLIHIPTFQQHFGFVSYLGPLFFRCHVTTEGRMARIL